MSEPLRRRSLLQLLIVTPLACLFGSHVASPASAALTPIPAPSSKPQPDGHAEYSYTESDSLGHITVITYDHQAHLTR